MSAADLLNSLSGMTIQERLAVIEAATKLIQRDLREPVSYSEQDEVLLRVAGTFAGAALTSREIDGELYGEIVPP